MTQNPELILFQNNGFDRNSGGTSTESEGTILELPHLAAMSDWLTDAVAVLRSSHPSHIFGEFAQYTQLQLIPVLAEAIETIRHHKEQLHTNLSTRDVELLLTPSLVPVLTHSAELAESQAHILARKITTYHDHSFVDFTFSTSKAGEAICKFEALDRLDQDRREQAQIEFIYIPGQPLQLTIQRPLKVRRVNELVAVINSMGFASVAALIPTLPDIDAREIKLQIDPSDSQYLPILQELNNELGLILEKRQAPVKRDYTSTWSIPVCQVEHASLQEFIDLVLLKSNLRLDDETQKLLQQGLQAVTTTHFLSEGTESTLGPGDLENKARVIHYAQVLYTLVLLASEVGLSYQFLYQEYKREDLGPSDWLLFVALSLVLLHGHQAIIKNVKSNHAGKTV